MVKAGWSIDDAERRLAAILGRLLTDEERSNLAVARATADALAEEHGLEYHGFGNPPKP